MSFDELLIVFGPGRFYVSSVHRIDSMLTAAPGNVLPSARPAEGFLSRDIVSIPVLVQATIELSEPGTLIQQPADHKSYKLSSSMLASNLPPAAITRDGAFWRLKRPGLSNPNRFPART
jgi:hypothetical protein